MIDFSIRNPLIVNLFLALVALAGIQAWNGMPQEMFPTVEQDKVRVTTIFEGASPEEVERQVTLPIEEALDGLPDIDVMTSTSTEGRSAVLVSLRSGADVDDFIRAAQNALDQITDLPEEAEEPQLVRLTTRFPVISVSLYGDVARAYLYDRAEQVRRELAQLPGVASVGVAGRRDWELWVTVDPQRLAARGVSLGQLRRALSENLRDLPGGSLKSSAGDIRLRGLGVPPRADAIEAIAVRADADGGVLRLGDIARVGVRFEEARTLGRFNGRPSVNLTINKTAAASTITVAAEARAYVDALRAQLPPGLRAGLFSDLSVYVKHRLETVKSSGLVGLALVLLSLYLLLNFRVAAITAMGIPVSFLVAVIFIQLTGYSINMVSLFAFLIALGLIVDDAIIVTENIYRHVEEGMAPRRAASIGAKEVFWPVVASTATTIAAFMPMFAIGGTMGAFISVIPAVVSASLLGSLFEAFGVLPSHAAEWLHPGGRTHSERRWRGLLDAYAGFLRRSLRHRYLLAVLSVGVLVITLTWAATRIPFVLFGNVAVGQFFVNVEAPNTYSLDDSAALAVELERLVRETIAPEELATLLTNVGVSFIDFHRVRLGSQYIQLIVDLKKKKPEGFIERFVSPLVSLRFDNDGERRRDTEAIIDALRARLERVPGIRRYSILRPQGGPAGADLEIGIVGQDVRLLRHEADRVRDYLRSLPATSDVRHDLDPGKLEYRYRLNARGRELGLTQQDLAAAVRTGFLGLEAVYVNWRNKRIPVRLIYDDRWRHDGAALERLPVSLNDGRVVWLRDVADIEVGRGFNTINRRDMRRLVTITGEVDDDIMTADQVVELVRQRFGDIGRRHPGYELLFLGEKKQAADSIRDVRSATWIALGAIFFILASLFRSLLDPLVVMFSIPFGAIGVVIGHALFGFHLQFLSLIGFLALTGIVVNDSLILVDFANQRRAAGEERIAAMVAAGRARIRPILLTSITTFLGISPLIFFATGQTAFLSPMAVSLGFGLIFSTLLILLALPSFWLIADDLRGLGRRLFGARSEPSTETLIEELK